MLWIVSWDCVTSLKKVKSKTTLPSIALVCDVPANDTDVVSVLGPERRRCVYPLSPSACSSIHSAISLLTNDVWAPVSTIAHRDAAHTVGGVDISVVATTGGLNQCGGQLVRTSVARELDRALVSAS